MNDDFRVGQDWKPVEYHDEFRYVNIGVAKIRELIKSETDPEELKVLNSSLKMLLAIQPISLLGVGEPYRGEPRPNIIVNSLSECINKESRVTHVFSGTLSYGGTGAVGNIIDVNFLTSNEEQTCQ
jgi:hypothetical protein